METKTRNYLIGAAALVLFFLGFFLGRSSSKEVEKIVTKTNWKKSVYLTEKKIPYPVPYAIVDTVWNDADTIIQPVDSANILADYEKTRKYKLDFSTDSTGVFIVDAVVNKNKLKMANSKVIPIVKSVYETKTVTNIKTLQFYGMLGSSIDTKVNQIQFGIDLKQRIMLGVSGIRFNDNLGVTINAGIKF